MLSDTSGYKFPEFMYKRVVSTGVVQHDYGSVFYVVQPSLYRNKLVFSEDWPDGSVVGKRGEQLRVR